MTMDRVYNSTTHPHNHHPPHDFQQQSSQHLHLPQQPPQQQTNTQQRQSLQPQHLYHHQHHHQQHHNHHLLLDTRQVEHNNHVPPILHRPGHPPPPPPNQLATNNNNVHQNVHLRHHNHPQHYLTTSTSNHDQLDQITAQTNNDSSTIPQSASLRSVHSHNNNSTNFHNRNSLQNSNYYVNAHYQTYQPPSLHAQQHHSHMQQPLINDNISSQRQQYNLDPRQYQATNYSNNQRQVSHPVIDSTDDTDSAVAQDQFNEEVITAILAARDALEKPIVERDERDILLIDNLCSLVHGFDAFPKTVRRALAAQAVLIVIEEEKKELIVDQEDLDSFCVLIFGECEQVNASKTVTIRRYKFGDSFGICEPTTEKIKFEGYMVTRREQCAFLCVKRDDFYTILTDPVNYPSLIRHRDSDGNVVCISQFDIDRKLSGSLWSYNALSTNPYKIILPNGHIIIKATEACLLLALVDGYDRIDSDYVDDFLLLFRVFMTHDQKDKEKMLPPGMIKLCLALAKWLDHNNYRDKVPKIVLRWLSSYYQDFELNSDFSYIFFRVLESKLETLAMKDHLHLLRATLSTKSKKRHVTISRSTNDQALAFAISGGYEKNCGIFVTEVNGLGCADYTYENLTSYLKYPMTTSDSAPSTQFDMRLGKPVIPPRHRASNNAPINQDCLIVYSRASVSLRPGDQILEVNGINFAAIKLVEAQNQLAKHTLLSLTVKYNPFDFYEMMSIKEGRRKPSLASVSSVSPYQPTINQSRFNFGSQELQHNNKLLQNHDQVYPPSSPLVSLTANFGFKSIVKTAPKGDRSRLSSLINTLLSSKQLAKQNRETTSQALSNNVETVSKTSGDNISDDQSCETDLGASKVRANSDSNNHKFSKTRQIESGLSNLIRLDDLNPASITEHSSSDGYANQTLYNVLRVFNAANNEFRYLLVHEETTAREVVMVAVKEFNLAGNSASQLSPGEKTVSSLNWHLYEVSVVPQSKTIKQRCLSDQTSRLAEVASLCSRFYIKNNSQSSFGPPRSDVGDDALVDEILKESPPNVTLTSLNATLLAVELTLSDFDKFRAIEPQQFVYDTFFDYSERKKANGAASADSASLKSSSSDGQDANVTQILNKPRPIPKNWMQEYQEFADISNKEMFWVVCEILNERNIGRRVKIVKQFVRVADVCSQLRNYNSMFAIISGLGHSCVGRLRRTFDKLKPKYKNQLEKMRSLFDPSKNMSNYRLCLSETPPPAIPLFPQIKKDLTFTKEGRSIFIRESNDMSDDEDLNSGYSQDTVKRRSRNDLLSVKSSTLDQVNNLPQFSQSRSISYSTFSNRISSSDADSILVNFAEIRQFTKRVRNVIYYSSLPYSNDLLTNKKDNQRNQAQIKKMHEEWQMRKRIRHYISQTLGSAINGTSSGDEKFDQTDGVKLKNNPNGRLNISYDERILYQKSLEVEPELNTRPTQIPDRTPQMPVTVMTSLVSAQPLLNPNQPLGPTTLLSMQPPSVANSSPTLSKSSSLSSCSSFNHHLPSYHLPARSNNLTSVGKFGTESTESLRKLQALSENVDDWRPYNNESNNGGINSKSANGDQSRSKSLVTSRIFPPKSTR